MKKLLFILIVFVGFIAQSQEKFELGLSVKTGFYFPENVRGNPAWPENAFSPGMGAFINYNLFEKTKLGTGLEVNYLNPKMKDFFNEPLNVLWHSINIPLSVKQNFGNSFFITGGVTSLFQFCKIIDKQQIPEINWNAGIGWDFRRFSLALQYNQGFKTIDKYIYQERGYHNVDVRHREISVRFEYSLWNF